MYPDSVSRVHFLFVLIYGKSGFFIKFVKTYSISIKMGEHICFRRNERLATVNPYWRGNPMVRGRFFTTPLPSGYGQCIEMAFVA